MTTNKDRAAVGSMMGVGRTRFQQSEADMILTEGRTAELENSLGVFRGRSVETPPAVGGRTRYAALDRLPPLDCIELAKGSQENEPQNPDARSLPMQSKVRKSRA